MSVTQFWNVDVKNGFAVQSQDGESVKLPTEKAEQLFQMLADRPGTLHDRSELARKLWPDKSSEDARHSLRQTAFLIRKGFDCQDILLGKSSQMSLNPERVSIHRRVLGKDNPGSALLMAAEWCAKSDPEKALGIVASAPDIAFLGGRRRCIDLCDDLLARCQESSAYVRVLQALGYCLHGEDYMRAISTYQRCVEMAPRFDEKLVQLRAIAALVFLHFETGDTQRALNLARSAKQKISGSNLHGQALITHSEGMCLAHGGDTIEGLAMIEQALELFQQKGLTQDVVHASLNVGWVSAQMDDRRKLERSVHLTRTVADEIGALRSLAILRYVDAQGSFMDRDWESALRSLRLAWQSVGDYQELSAMAQPMESAAEVAISRGDLESGAEYLVRAHYHRSVRKRQYSPTERKRLAKSIKAVKPLLTPEKTRRWAKQQEKLESLEPSLITCPY
ncbi:MAG TPA: hypothetical protein VG944_23655 [Fimbriimonas sp.]|nr:hypothetical protein [Fimbriimonas sp.]